MLCGLEDRFPSLVKVFLVLDDRTQVADKFSDTFSLSDAKRYLTESLALNPESTEAIQALESIQKQNKGMFKNYS